MFISPIFVQNNYNNAFEGRRRKGRYVKYNPSVKVLRTKERKAAVIAASIAGAASLSNIIDEFYGEKRGLNIENLIKRSGITYFTKEDDKLIAASRKNGAFYKIKLPIDIPNEKLKIVLWAELNNKSGSCIPGLSNYKKCIDDIGRQDIIQKGLGIFTYELNNEIPHEKKIVAAALINDQVKDTVTSYDLFYIGDDAYYYDKENKSVYSVSTLENSIKGIKQKVCKCDFITDEDGNAVGYNRNKWNIYSQSTVEEKYVEQQKPSEKLPEYADINKNKQYAEACRFGNYYISNRNRDGIPNVLAHLKKFGFDNVTEKDLQFVRGVKGRFKDDNDFYLINYYNPLTGKSLTYDKNGKYMYQTEYIKDNDGNIISCNH